MYHNIWPKRGQIKELFHLFYPLTLTYPKKKLKMRFRLSGWEYDQLQNQEAELLLKTDGSYVIKYMLLQTSLQVMPMIFTVQWQKMTVFAFFICMNTQLTFIHTGGKKKNYNDGRHLGLELTDSQADYSAFSGHMTSGLHPVTLSKEWASGMLLIYT